jgi:hypothetical protein
MVVTRGCGSVAGNAVVNADFTTNTPPFTLTGLRRQ